MNNERNLNQLGLSLYLGKGSGGEGGGKWGGFLGVFWLDDCFLEFNKSVVLIFGLVNFNVF